MQAESTDVPLKMAVSVPKRLFKRAVNRNLLKRRIREAYRLQKPLMRDFLEKAGHRLHLVIQYRGREIKDHQTIVEKLHEGFESLRKELEAT